MADHPNDDPIPAPRASDPENVSWALSTAAAMWSRGDRADAVKWLRRGAEAASEADDDDRALELAKIAAELSGRPERRSNMEPRSGAALLEATPLSAGGTRAPAEPPRHSLVGRAGHAATRPPTLPQKPLPSEPLSGARPPTHIPNSPPRSPAPPSKRKPPPLPASPRPASPLPASPLPASPLPQSPFPQSPLPANPPEGGPPWLARRRFDSQSDDEPTAVEVIWPSDSSPGGPPRAPTPPPKPEGVGHSTAQMPVLSEVVASEMMRGRRPLKPLSTDWDTLAAKHLAGASPAVGTNDSPLAASTSPTTPPPQRPPSSSSMRAARTAPGLEEGQRGVRAPVHQSGALVTTQAVRVILWKDAHGVHVAPAGTLVSAITVDAMLVALDPAADLTAWLDSNHRKT